MITIISVLRKIISLLNVDNSPIQVNLIEHRLFFLIVFVNLLLLDLPQRKFLQIFLTRFRLCFFLLFKHNNSIRIIFDGLIIPTQQSFGVGFTKIVFDHVIVTILKSLSDVF